MGAGLGIVALILGAPVLLLALPIRVAFRLEHIGSFHGKIAIRGVFGLVRFRARFPGRYQALPGPTPAPELNQPNDRPPVLALFWQAAFRQRVYRLATDMAKATHLNSLRLRLRLGLGHPADTGRLWAVMGPLSALAQSLRGADVQIEPEFMEPVCEFRASGRLRLVPLQYLALAVGFAMSPVCIRAWRSLHGAA